MKTTLGKIKTFDPCTDSWKKAIKYMKKNNIKYDSNIEVTLKQILEVVGIEDAVWCLRCFKYKEYYLFLADIAELVYPIYKKYNPHDYILWNCIQSIHYYYHGFITKRQLLDAAHASARAAYAVATAYAAVCMAARTAEAAAITSIYAAARTAYAAHAADTTYIAYAAAAADAKWKEIEQLFIQHFCE